MLKICPLGLVLGEVVFVSVMLIGWGSSALDFAYPVRTLLAVFVRLIADQTTVLFPLARLMMARLYW